MGGLGLNPGLWLAARVGAGTLEVAVGAGVEGVKGVVVISFAVVRQS